ncbi:MAG: cellulase family glycosylhydrolase [Cyclobacteriaceae bacterium]|nr:cellulase family glycosylhydrolase [Cyclobacteriaceae bacterium]
MERRDFIKTTGMSFAAVGLAGPDVLASVKSKNRIPAWKGFNLLDFFSPNPIVKQRTTEEHFKWMRDWGFDFVRIPIAYPSYLDFDRSRAILPEEVYQISESAVEKIDSLVAMAHHYKMHVSLNLHRAPGYCVNAGFNEPYNLWRDQPALDAFCFHWNFWAKRYKNVSSKKISFDLLNEPSMREDMNDQHSQRNSVPDELYRKMALTAAEAIRKENPKHLIIADGNNVGNTVIPEIVDLNIAQSCRGYYPGAISHYKAPWAFKDIDNLPAPQWPGKVGDVEFNRAMLETYYKPWIDLAKSGVGVHCGECGCWNKTPHDIFLSWFGDVLGILRENKIGFALWEFVGDFGVLDSKREDAHYVDWYGHKLDKKLLDILARH